MHRRRQAAEAGKSREEVAAIVNALIPKLNLIFLLDTLEYLRRGGRIGGARAMLGTLLNVKPLLQLENGQVEPLEQPRSRAKAIKRLLEILEERAGGKPLHVGVLHAEVPERSRHPGETPPGAVRVRGVLHDRDRARDRSPHRTQCALGLAFYTD